MRFADILKMCFDSLSRRKGRTILTVLGVFIGCTSIIVMVSIGAGMQESYDQMLKNMGDLSIIEVYRGYNQNTGEANQTKLDEKAVESFHEIAGVQAVMPKASLDDYNISFKAGINGRYTANWVDFAGIDSSALEDMGFELILLLKFSFIAPLFHFLLFYYTFRNRLCQAEKQKSFHLSGLIPLGMQVFLLLTPILPPKVPACQPQSHLFRQLHRNIPLVYCR